MKAEKKLEEYIRKNKIKIKNTEFDLEKILKKFDKDFQNKLNKENEIIFKNIFWKKIKQLNLESISNLIEKCDNNDNSEENDKIQKYKNKILKNLDEKKRKIILANNYMRRDGRDWITDNSREGKNIDEKIKNAENELCDVAERVIVQELRELLNKEMEPIKKQKENKLTELNKQRELYSEKKKKYDSNLESYNNRVKNYNLKNKQLNEDIVTYNKNLEEYTKDKSKIDKSKLDNDLKKIKDFQEEHKKEKEEIDKIAVEIDKEKDNVNKDYDFINKLVEEHNKYNSEVNDRIDIYNDLKNYLIIDFSKDEIKIDIKKKDIDMPNFYNGIKQIEKDSNLAFKDELEKISKFEKEKENSIEMVKKRNEFELKILKIIKEKHNYWENCFNKAFYALKYVYNSDDMKRIINHQINKKNKNNDYYYLKDINNHNNINKAKENLSNKKVILGNYFNDNNGIWDNYCILSFNNSNVFLYKSPEGNNPPENLVNAIQEITGGGYIAKINKTKQKNEKLLTDVDAIENDKIIMEEIEKNKKDFINKFEKYSKFYNETKEIKEKIKQNTYPEEYIKGLYDEIKNRNNALRISIIFFRHYFLDEENDNEINIEFLNKIYNILLNYNQIEQKEKDILNKEYNDILDVYNNVYAEIKKEEEQEQKEVEEIVQNKGKRKHNIKNYKKTKETINQNKNDESALKDKNNSNHTKSINKISNNEYNEHNENNENTNRPLILKNDNNENGSLGGEINNERSNDVIIYNDYNIILKGAQISDKDLKNIEKEFNYNENTNQFNKKENYNDKQEGFCEKLCKCFKKNDS